MNEGFLRRSLSIVICERPGSASMSNAAFWTFASTLSRYVLTLELAFSATCIESSEADERTLCRVGTSHRRSRNTSQVTRNRRMRIRLRERNATKAGVSMVSLKVLLLGLLLDYDVHFFQKCFAELNAHRLRRFFVDDKDQFLGYLYRYVSGISAAEDLVRDIGRLPPGDRIIGSKPEKGT